MKKLHLLGAACAWVFSFISMQANATLISRLGGLAYYDDAIDATWLADANYAETSGFHDNHLLSWYEAIDFIAWLNGSSHLGIDTWRLPDMDVNGDEYVVKCSVATETECRDNELGYMSVVYGAEPGNELVFDNVFYNYWSSTDYDADNVDWPGGATCNVGPEGLCAWRQGFSADSQNYVRKTYGEPYDGPALGYSVWAVASGDVLAPIPEPPLLWLLVPGLLGLIRVANKRTA
jgi:hypothetical protein